VIVDTDTSTVTIADRRFPAVCVVCPNAEGQDDSEAERLLGGEAIPVAGPARGRRSYQALIPCENGVLVAVEWEADTPDVYRIMLEARTCALSTLDTGGPLWLPHTVGVKNGRLVALPPGPYRDDVAWYWINAEPEWTVEHIDRITTMAFTQPPGPSVRLITLVEATRL
jgi:hypothetical protein